MQVLTTLTDATLGIPSDTALEKRSSWKERVAARAVLYDADHRVAIIHAEKRKFNKIPGGGVEIGENIEQALLREIREETGCTARIVKPIGSIIEERSQYGLRQTTTCFLAEVIAKGTPTLEQREKDDAFSLHWLTPKEALEEFSSHDPTEYSAVFMHTRDFLLLKKGLELL